VGAGLRLSMELLGPEYSMSINSLDTDLKVFFSRNVKGSAGEDLVEKQNAEMGLMPVVSNEALNSKISEHFGESPFFAILEMQEENNITLLKDYTIQTNKYINEEKRKGILISEWLLSEKIDKLYLKKELKKGPNLILENSFVQINIDEFECLKDIIEQEKQNQSS